MTSGKWRRGVIVIVLAVGGWAAWAQAQAVIGGPVATDWYERWNVPVPGLQWYTPPLPGPNIYVYGYGVPPVYVPPAPGLVPQVTPYAYPSPLYWPQPFPYGYQPPLYQYEPFPYGYQPSWPQTYRRPYYQYRPRYWRNDERAGQQDNTGRRPPRRGSVRPVPYLQSDVNPPTD